jgi:hypothetical protein
MVTSVGSIQLQGPGRLLVPPYHKDHTPPVPARRSLRESLKILTQKRLPRGDKTAADSKYPAGLLQTIFSKFD